MEDAQPPSAALLPRLLPLPLLRLCLLLLYVIVLIVHHGHPVVFAGVGVQGANKRRGKLMVRLQSVGPGGNSV